MHTDREEKELLYYLLLRNCLTKNTKMMLLMKLLTNMGLKKKGWVVGQTMSSIKNDFKQSKKKNNRRRRRAIDKN